MTVVGLITMPPLAPTPEASRRHFASLRELAAEHGLRELSMGTSQDYLVAVQEGAGRLCDLARACTGPARHNHSRELLSPTETSIPRWPYEIPGTARSCTSGLADDEDYEEDVEPYNEPEVEAPGAYRERPNVRRLSSRRRRDEFDDIFADDPESRTSHDPHCGP